MTEGDKPPKGGMVVVGVDGSAGSNEALRWAIAEARLRKTALRAVHALKFDYVAGGAEGSPEAERTGIAIEHAGHPREIHQAAHAVLERAIAEVAKDVDASRSSATLSRAAPRKCSSTPSAATIFSWSARAATAALPTYCSAPSANSAPTTPLAQSWSCTPAPATRLGDGNRRLPP